MRTATLNFVPHLLSGLVSLSRGAPLPDAYQNVSFITLEEHWIAPTFVDLFINSPTTPLINGQALVPNLTDIGPRRLADMDANNISIQIISSATISAEANYLIDQNKLSNDQLAARISNATYKNRFRGFCQLPMAFPDAAASELRRCVTELGFVGALIDSHIIVGAGPNGTGGNGHQVFHDSPAFDKLWSTAVDLGVPIYLHPAFPPIDDITSDGSGLYAPSTSSGSFTYGFAARLGSAGWGWHSNTGLSFLKLYGAGVFDRFPKLQIVLGHMGEMVPYYLWRADRVLSLGRAHPLLTLRQVYQNNVHVTTAGFFSLEALHTLLNVTDTKRIMYSVDYPFGSNEDGKTFMETLSTSGLVSTEEYKDIAYRNAQRLLQLQ